MQSGLVFSKLLEEKRVVTPKENEEREDVGVRGDEL
jgi:hypothetical protein